MVIELPLVYFFVIIPPVVVVVALVLIILKLLFNALTAHIVFLIGFESNLIDQLLLQLIE